jgi:O-antigen ligase
MKMIKSNLRIPVQGRSGLSLQFYVLCCILLMAFVLGGSSRGDVPTLTILRPFALASLFFALYKIKLGQLKNFKYLVAMAMAITILVLFHTVPLPPNIWQSLPGREIVLDVHKSANINGAWLPLAMVPHSADNALYSLSVPLATLFLAVQLPKKEHLYIIILLAILIMLSSLIGLIQAAGIEIKLYDINSDMSGIFANRNHQALFISMFFPVAACLSSIDIDPLRRKAYQINLFVFLALFIVLLVFVTGSRMGVFLSIIGIVSAALIYNPTASLSGRGFQSKQVKVLLASIVAILGLSLLALSVNSRNVALSRFSDIDNDSRQSLWADVWEFLPNYMPWGSGVGSYVEIYQIHEDNDLLSPQYSNHAHNDWLELILTMGYPGVALLVLAIVMYSKGLYSTWSSGVSRPTVRALGFAIIAMLAIASTVDYPLRTPLLAALFALASVWAAQPQKCQASKGEQFNG